MKIIFFIVLLLALIVGAVRYLEKTSVFFPTRSIEITPEALGLNYEDVVFETEDEVQLNAWYVPGLSDGSLTVLFFHGNGGNISSRLDKIKILHDLNVNVFIVDYRGYGKSQGSPSEVGIYRDAQASYTYLIQSRNTPAESIVLMGESLGGAPAVDLASKVDVAGLIIDSSFSNAVDMAKRMYSFIPGFLIQLKFDSESKIVDIKIPKLFIHSREDEMIPFALGQKLFKAAPEPKVFLEITGGHNEGYDLNRDRYIDALRTYFQNLTRSLL